MCHIHKTTSPCPKCRAWCIGLKAIIFQAQESGCTGQFCVLDSLDAWMEKNFGHPFYALPGKARMTKHLNEGKPALLLLELEKWLDKNERLASIIPGLTKHLKQALA